MTPGRSFQPWGCWEGRPSVSWHHLGVSIGHPLAVVLGQPYLPPQPVFGGGQEEGQEGPPPNLCPTPRLCPLAVGPGVQLPEPEAVGPVALHDWHLGGRHHLWGSLGQVRVGGTPPYPWGGGAASWRLSHLLFLLLPPLFLLLPHLFFLLTAQVRPPVSAHLVLPSDGHHGDMLLLRPHFHRLLPLPLPHGHGLLRHPPQQRLPLYVATTNPMVPAPDTLLLRSMSPCVSAALEWMPTRTRALVGTFMGYWYTIGQFLLAGVAYAIPDWRWLQFTVSVPFLCFFLYSW